MAAEVYQLKVTVHQSKPPIWRRLLVPGDATLADLHAVLQIAFRWQNYHLHQFTVAGVNYAVPSPEDFEPVRDERRARLQSVAGAGGKLRYCYDFGDDWIHTILVEKVLPPAGPGELPRCVAGARAGPLEDSGGIWGYQNMFTVLADASDPGHREIAEWIPAGFDPVAFDQEAINRDLAKLGARWQGAAKAPAPRARR